MVRIIIILSILSFHATVFGEPAAVLELQRAALSSNPLIKATESEAEMVKKLIPQSDALEDPKLKLGLNNVPAKSFSFTKEDMTSKEIGISQMIPLGRLAYKRKIAMQEYERAIAKFKAEKVETLHLIRMNYYELMYAVSSIRILGEIKKQIKLVVDSEVAAAKSGTGSLANVIKAKIEYNMVDEEVINLTQKEKELRASLNYLAGVDVDIKPAALPVPDYREFQSEEVRKEILAANPELKMIMLETEISKNEIAQKKAEYAPDMDVGLSYMQRQDGRRHNSFDTMLGMGGASTVYKSEKVKRDDMISAMVTLSIPFWFWKKNIPMVEEMKRKNDMAKNLYRDTQNKMNARAETLVSQLIRWRDLYKLYHDRLIPETELAFETNLARYRTSAVEFMSVVDTVRMLLRYRKELIMAVKEYHVSYSELNALMGVEVLP